MCSHNIDAVYSRRHLFWNVKVSIKHNPSSLPMVKDIFVLITSITKWVLWVVATLYILVHEIMLYFECLVPSYTVYWSKVIVLKIIRYMLYDKCNFIYLGMKTRGLIWYIRTNWLPQIVYVKNKDQRTIRIILNESHLLWPTMGSGDVERNMSNSNIWLFGIWIHVRRTIVWPQWNKAQTKPLFHWIIIIIISLQLRVYTKADIEEPPVCKTCSTK